MVGVLQAAFGTTSLAVAAVSLGVAALLLGRGFNSPVHRAFALFLVLQGVASATGLLSFGGPAGAEYAGRVVPYFVLAAIPVLFAGVVLALGPRVPDRPRRALLLGLGVVTLAVLLLYLVDHGAWTSGALPLVGALATSLLAPAAYLLAREAARAGREARRVPLLLSMGLALPLFHAVAPLPLMLVSLGNILAPPVAGIATGGAGTALAFLAMRLVILAFLVGVVLHWVRLARARVGEGEPKGRAWSPLGLAVVALLMGLFSPSLLLVAGFASFGALEALIVTQIILGLPWQLALPAALALAYGRGPPSAPGEGSRTGAASEPA